MIDELKLDGSSDIELALEIGGQASGTTKVRLVVRSTPNILIDATETGDGKYSLSIPVLPFIAVGQYEYSIEVIIGNKIYTPITDTLDATRELVPTISKVSSKKTESDDVEIKIVKPKKIKEAAVSTTLVTYPGYVTILK